LTLGQIIKVWSIQRLYRVCTTQTLVGLSMQSRW